MTLRANVGVELLVLRGELRLWKPVAMESARSVCKCRALLSRPQARGGDIHRVTPYQSVHGVAAMSTYRQTCDRYRVQQKPSLEEEKGGGHEDTSVTHWRPYKETKREM